MWTEKPTIVKSGERTTTMAPREFLAVELREPGLDEHAVRVEIVDREGVFRRVGSSNRWSDCLCFILVVSSPVTEAFAIARLILSPTGFLSSVFNNGGVLHVGNHFEPPISMWWEEVSG
jgi:hypothetical protein